MSMEMTRCVFCNAEKSVREMCLCPESYAVQIAMENYEAGMRSAIKQRKSMEMKNWDTMDKEMAKLGICPTYSYKPKLAPTSCNECRFQFHGYKYALVPVGNSGKRVMSQVPADYCGLGPLWEPIGKEMGKCPAGVRKDTG